MKFKVNDIVKVIKNTSFHCFKVGEEIKIVSVNSSYYDAVSVADETSYWSIYEADCEEILKERFSNAQIGDKVYCLLNGKGTITTKTDSTISVKFLDTFPCCYWRNGKLDKKHLNPSLFYDDGNGNMVIERPAPSVHWEKVPIDTKVIVKDRSLTLHRRFASFSNGDINIFVRGTCSFTNEDCGTFIVNSSSVFLGEDITIDGIFYPKGIQI